MTPESSCLGWRIVRNMMMPQCKSFWLLRISLGLVSDRYWYYGQSVIRWVCVPCVGVYYGTPANSGLIRGPALSYESYHTVEAYISRRVHNYLLLSHNVRPMCIVVALPSIFWMFLASFLCLGSDRRKSSICWQIESRLLRERSMLAGQAPFVTLLPRTAVIFHTWSIYSSHKRNQPLNMSGQMCILRGRLDSSFQTWLLPHDRSSCRAQYLMVPQQW